MTGVKGKSGRRIASPSTLDKLITHADTVVLRAIQNEDIPELDRARLAAQFSLKKMAERVENVNVNMQLSDELVRRVIARLGMEEPEALPPPVDVFVLPEPSEEPNEPKA